MANMCGEMIELNRGNGNRNVGFKRNERGRRNVVESCVWNIPSRKKEKKDKGGPRKAKRRVLDRDERPIPKHNTAPSNPHAIPFRSCR
nr:hypothetical protein Itr_chr08CG04100 [Ipomoea trifida]